MIKLFNCEAAFLQRVSTLRDKETHGLLKAGAIKSANSALAFALPLLVCLASFSLYPPRIDLPHLAPTTFAGFLSSSPLLQDDPCIFCLGGFVTREANADWSDYALDPVLWACWLWHH